LLSRYVIIDRKGWVVGGQFICLGFGWLIYLLRIWVADLLRYLVADCLAYGASVLAIILTNAFSHRDFERRLNFLVTI
jgi:hypothetical protein